MAITKDIIMKVPPLPGERRSNAGYAIGWTAITAAVTLLIAWKLKLFEALI